jgi:subtilisin family serine protease
MTARFRSCRPFAASLARLLTIVVVAILLDGAPWLGSPAPAGARDTRPAPPLTIVVLADGVDPVAAARQLGVKPTYVYTDVFSGFAARLPAASVAAARRAKSVVELAPDAPLNAAGQTIPTGVARIDAPQNPIWQDQQETGVDADVAVLDTGIAPLPDLNVQRGKACVGKNPTRDNDGHGTGVAGIIGAKDNGSGIVGVAPGARLWAVKVLDGNGNGTQASAICGLDWVYKNRATIDVVNMSFAGTGKDGACKDNPFHRAICTVVAAGIPVVAAAGNAHADVATTVPAVWAETIAVAAFADSDGKPGGLGPQTCDGERDDTFASFSNFGAAVDIMAPGSCILSFVPNGEAFQASGTSESAPHVTGALALFKSTDPGATADAARHWLVTVAARPQDSPQGIDPTTNPRGDEPVLFLGP